jgi:hypothetical protein
MRCGPYEFNPETIIFARLIGAIGARAVAARACGTAATRGRARRFGMLTGKPEG